MQVARHVANDGIGLGQRRQLRQGLVRIGLELFAMQLLDMGREIVNIIALPPSGMCRWQRIRCSSIDYLIFHNLVSGNIRGRGHRFDLRQEQPLPVRVPQVARRRRRFHVCAP